MISACHLQVSLACGIICQTVTLQHYPRSAPHRLASSTLSYFLVAWCSSGDTRGPSVVFDVSCPGPLNVSNFADYVYDLCPPSDPDVGLSILVCDVEHTPFHFGLCGHKFVPCLFGQCPGLCTICHSWQHTRVVHLSRQAEGKVAFEEMPVFGACRSACHDIPLYLLFLVLFPEPAICHIYT